MKIISFVLALLLSTSAFANSMSSLRSESKFEGITDRVVITSDYGGVLTEYIDKYNQWRQGGEQVEVSDICLSACTLMVGLLNRDQVCVEPTAIFGFHSATSGLGEFSLIGTHLLWALYPDAVKSLLISKGWDGGSNDPAKAEHPDLVYFPGSTFFEPCK